MLTYTGFLKVKNQTRQVSEKFKTREFVLTDDAAQYPQTISFQLTQDRCQLIEGAKVGDEITVHFLLKGREWKNPQGEIKYFNSLDVFRVEKIIRRNASQQESEEPASKRKQQEEPTFSNETLLPTPDDDLPF